MAPPDCGGRAPAGSNDAKVARRRPTRAPSNRAADRKPDRALQQIECFEAGIKFAKTEGIIPAPEANHGIAQVIREALKAKEEGVSKTILLNLCGHGYFDMSAYEAYFSGKLENHELTDEQLYTELRKLQTPEAA